MNYFTQKVSTFMKMLIFSLSLFLFSLTAHAQCTVERVTQNGGTPSYPSSNHVDRLIIFEQNASPISFTIDIVVYCSTQSRVKIYDIGELSGHNGNATRGTQIMLDDLKPTRYEGEGYLTINVSTGSQLRSTSNFFTRATTNFGVYPYAAGTRYTIRYTLPALMLYSPIIGKRREYETGGTLYSICNVEDGTNCTRLSLVLSLEGIRENTCLAGAFKTSVDKPSIDFGSVSKKEMESGKQLKDNFTITVEKTSTKCNSNVSPKIIFNSGTLYNDQNIDLQNGLTLKLKDEKGHLVKFGQATGEGIIGRSDKLLKMKFDALIEKKPGNAPIKSGPFSSVVIYTMEYY